MGELCYVWCEAVITESLSTLVIMCRLKIVWYDPAPPPELCGVSGDQPRIGGARLVFSIYLPPPQTIFSFSPSTVP